MSEEPEILTATFWIFGQPIASISIASNAKHSDAEIQAVNDVNVISLGDVGPER